MVVVEYGTTTTVNGSGDHPLHPHPTTSTSTTTADMTNNINNNNNNNSMTIDFPDLLLSDNHSQMLIDPTMDFPDLTFLLPDFLNNPTTVNHAAPTTVNTTNNITNHKSITTAVTTTNRITNGTNRHHHPHLLNDENANANQILVAEHPSSLLPTTVIDESADIYGSVTQAHNYHEGFTHLISYIKSALPKDLSLRICRAIAHFRPAYMSSIMNLTGADLIFMEQTLQRTLKELKKLIPFSGTPTAVWRRTGEILMVNPEFLKLVGLSTQEFAASGKVYIYELMDETSSVEYWEKYAEFAFDTSHRAITALNCDLKRGGKRGKVKVPTAMSFTMKRDVFDMVSVIIGSFLPVLNDDECVAQ